MRRCEVKNLTNKYMPSEVWFLQPTAKFVVAMSTGGDNVCEMKLNRIEYKKKKKN